MLRRSWTLKTVAKLKKADTKGQLLSDLTHIMYLE